MRVCLFTTARLGNAKVGLILGPMLGLMLGLCASTACRASVGSDAGAVSWPERVLSGSAVGLEPDSDADDAPMEAGLSLGPDGRDLRLIGDLTEGIADRVAVLLAAHPAIERLHLTSDGGLVDEALALGALVAAHGLATYVPEVCASACTLVYVRGRGRYLASGGRLGFHGPYVVGFFDTLRAVDSARERTAYLNAGLSSDFVAQALAVHADAMWIPDASRLLAAGVVTEIVASGLPDPAIDPDRGARRPLALRAARRDSN